MTEIHLVRAWLLTYTDRWGRKFRDEAGYTTEMVIVTALIAVAAIAIVGIIVAKFTSKANSIPTG